MKVVNKASIFITISFSDRVNSWIMFLELTKIISYYNKFRCSHKLCISQTHVTNPKELVSRGDLAEVFFTISVPKKLSIFIRKHLSRSPCFSRVERRLLNNLWKHHKATAWEPEVLSGACHTSLINNVLSMLILVWK